MSLQDQLDADYAEGWQPNPGDSVIGEVMEIGTRDSSYGPYRIITIKREDGSRVAVHAFHQILENELKRIKPQVGHRIGIKYLGKPEGKNYANYKAATENPPEAKWDDEPDEAGLPPSDVPNEFGPEQRPDIGGSRGTDPDQDNIPF